MRRGVPSKRCYRWESKRERLTPKPIAMRSRFTSETLRFPRSMSAKLQAAKCLLAAIMARTDGPYCWIETRSL